MNIKITLITSLLILSFNFSQAMTADHWVGGQRTPALSLLAIRSEYSQKTRVGRLLLELGLRNGMPMCCKPGYYHVEVAPRLQRAVITLKKASFSKFGLKYFKNIIERSRFVRSADLLVDPVDKDMVITLYLRKNVALKTREISTKERRTYLGIYLKQIRTSDSKSSRKIKPRVKSKASMRSLRNSALNFSPRKWGLLNA